MSNVSAAASRSKRSPSKESSNREALAGNSLSTAAPAVTKTPMGQSFRDMIFGSGSAGRKSPVSPPRITRLQEKEEMQNLNDRLVIYIDTVRRLEAENVRLSSLVTMYTEHATKDVTDIKTLYERELEDAKRLIDDLAKEKAKYEIDMNKYKAEADEALGKLAKREKELKKLDADYKSAQSEAQEFKSRYESVQTDNARKAEELAQLRPHATDLEKQLAKLKKQLEDETLLRVDLENKNQTLREDLQFKSQLYEKEVDQVRSSKRIEIEQVDVRLRDEYDSKLMDELQRIRDETESKIQEMKDEVERRYKSKLAEQLANAKREAQSSVSLRDELASSQTKIDELNADIKIHLTKIGSLEAKIRDLEDRLRRANAKYETDIATKDNELATLRKEMQDLLLEYQELYDIKIALDMEIGAYRKLLESEEQRLNISAGHQQTLGGSFLNESGAAIGQTRSAAKKRKMTASAAENQDEQVVASSVISYKQTATSASGIEIVEHDFDGKSVKLTNTTDKDIAIGGWQLKRLADGQEIDYKFNKSTVLKPGQTITVWSSNSGATHVPPNDLLMQSQQRWIVGDKMATILVDKEANEQAKRESQKHVGSEKKLRAAPSNSPSVVQKLFRLWK